MDVPDWCGLPLISGNWTDLSGTDALTMAFEIGATLTDGPEAFDDLRIERLRARPIACYPGALLVEMQARIGERLGLSNHLYGPWGLVTLDGGSAVLHDLNEIDGTLKLDRAEQAADYHLLFCNTVRGDAGRFRIVAAPEPVAWGAGAGPDEACALLERPVSLRAEPDRWVIDSPVFYDGALFQARFELNRNGMIEMVDDDPLAIPFPVEAESWSGPFRIPNWGVPA